MADDSMLQQAITALREGENVRARELLTRLIKTNPTNPEYWLWMSTVVDTQRERTYCLQEALRLDPQNQSARRGLVLMGAFPGSEGAGAEAGMLRREWTARQPDISQMDKTGAKLTLRRFLVMSVGGAAVIALVTLALISMAKPKANTAYIRPLPPTLRPSATLLPTNTLVVKTATPTFVGPTPLWMFLEETYTPTPFYGKTPHPRMEAYNTGVKRFERGAWADVITFMQQVIISEPGAVDAYYYMGEAYRMQAKYDLAIEQFDKAIEVNKRYAPAYLGRARARYGANPGENVDDDLNKAIELDEDLGEAYLERAYTALQRGDSLAAIRSLPKAEELLPGSPIVFLYEAEANLAQRHPEEALQQAKRANELDMTLLESYLVLGEAYQANDLPDSSIEPLRTYLIYESDDQQARLAMGRGYLAMGDLDNALKTVNTVLEADNHNIDAYLERGDVYLALDQAETALDDFNTAAKMNAKSFAANLGKGKALLALDHFKDAYNQLDRTRPLAVTDDDLAAIYYWRALAEEALGDFESAASDWEALLALPTEVLPHGWGKIASEHLAFTPTPRPTPSETPAG